MDMTSMTMDMSSTTTTAAAAATSTSMSMDMDMGGSGDMGGGNSCKISMLWNWNTIDACFLSSSWHITSLGMFAGSCIGVILLTMSLEFMRRTVKEYDRYLIRKHAAVVSTAGNTPLIGNQSPTKTSPSTSTTIQQAVKQIRGFKPSLLEQAIRAFLHMVQFAVAYFIMLLAMYFNGYIIICIFIGAYLGAFVFHWETLDGSRSATSASQDPSVCCA